MERRHTHRTQTHRREPIPTQIPSNQQHTHTRALDSTRLCLQLNQPFVLSFHPYRPSSYRQARQAARKIKYCVECTSITLQPIPSGWVQ